MAYRAAVVGASGYTGAELLRILALHPEIEVVTATADANAGTPVVSLYPALATAYGEMLLSALDVHALEGLDLVFLALPQGESQRHAGALVETVGHLVDLAADFRLPADSYRGWYGEAHAAPALLEQFAYGLPELFREEIRRYRHVANPGCYPTAAVLALAPAVARRLVDPAGMVVNAVSGISGRGRSLAPESLFTEANESVSAYGLLTHRHTAEIELALSAVAGGPTSVLFTPHVAPMTRGLLATCAARSSTAGLSTEALLDYYREFYRDEPFVLVVADPPPTKVTFAANTVYVTVRYDDRTGTVLALAAEDNLVKGAAGQAVQNANLLLALPETTGLPTVGVTP